MARTAFLIVKNGRYKFAIPMENVEQIDTGDAPPLFTKPSSDGKRIVLKDGRSFVVDDVVDVVEAEPDDVKQMPFLLALHSPFFQGVVIVDDSPVFILM